MTVSKYMFTIRRFAKGSANCVLLLFIALIFIRSPSLALDWDDSEVVASCHKYPGFGRDGELILEALRQKNIIQTHISYLYSDKEGFASVPDAKTATDWELRVIDRDAARAREIIAQRLKKGSKIKIVEREKPASAAPATPRPPKGSLSHRILHFLGL